MNSYPAIDPSGNLVYFACTGIGTIYDPYVPTRTDLTLFAPAPFLRALPVTPSDTVDLAAGPTRGVYIGGSGEVTAMVNGVQVSFVGLVAGTTLNVQVSRVFATNTTATNLIALY